MDSNKLGTLDNQMIEHPELVIDGATALAPEVGLHPASGRTALLRAVRAAQSAAEGDSA